METTTESKSIEATSRMRWKLFAEFVACLDVTRLPKFMMFGELVGGAYAHLLLALFA